MSAVQFSSSPFMMARRGAGGMAEEEEQLFCPISSATQRAALKRRRKKEKIRLFVVSLFGSCAASMFLATVPLHIIFEPHLAFVSRDPPDLIAVSLHALDSVYTHVPLASNCSNL